MDHQGTSLTDLFWYWQERAMLENGLPSLENFQFADKTLPWVDVTTEDPMYFTLRNHPGGICGNWDNARFIDYPVAIHATACALEYFDCKEHQQPIYTHIHQMIQGVKREYAKLMVPVADKNGNTTQVFYAWQFLRYPLISGRSA